MLKQLTTMYGNKVNKQEGYRWLWSDKVIKQPLNKATDAMRQARMEKAKAVVEQQEKNAQRRVRPSQSLPSVAETMHAKLADNERKRRSQRTSESSSRSSTSGFKIRILLKRDSEGQDTTCSPALPRASMFSPIVQPAAKSARCACQSSDSGRSDSPGISAADLAAAVKDSSEYRAMVFRLDEMQTELDSLKAQLDGAKTKLVEAATRADVAIRDATATATDLGATLLEELRTDLSAAHQHSARLEGKVEVLERMLNMRLRTP
jgi:uncharacterized protein (DUF3084 family)